MLKKYSWLIIIIIFAAVYLGKYLYSQPKYTNGKTAPAIEGKLINGLDFELKDLKGQYVLIDFWGSWCGPCRAQSPHMRDLYSKFNKANFDNGEGFTIVNIGVEKDTSRWLRAIAQDQLNWPYHIMDQTSSLRFFNGKISKQYGIVAVPSSYLVDPIGNIIGTNMAPEHIDRLLEQHLSK